MNKTTKVLAILITLLFLLSSFSFAARKAKPVKTTNNQVKININTANVNQLSTLPRIGVKIGNRIINFRKKHGKFKKIEEIMKVKGVGEKVFQKIKNRIKVS
jgi:competence protein ComEA